MSQPSETRRPANMEMWMETMFTELTLAIENLKTIMVKRRRNNNPLQVRH